MDNEQKTHLIKVWGIVQGVGFRPFIKRLATQYNITGQVCNSGSMVEIVASGLPNYISIFIDQIKLNKPKTSYIVKIDVMALPYKKYDSFNIINSKIGVNEIMMPSSDLSVCENCISELENAENTRSQHPFISCMECGPRYSIIKTLPYDRENTSMLDYTMCDDCVNEYTDISNRRCHAQTISCHNCGPYLIYMNFDGVEQTHRQAFESALKALSDGKIIAVKGIGGYHFVCSPFIDNTIKTLRKIKNRDEKPFAVMFENVQQIRRYCDVSSVEEELLISQARPIVLLKCIDGNISREVYKTSRQLGAFVPYTPLQHMLIKLFGPLIMTSANISDLPIIINDSDIRLMLNKNLFAMLYNTREICVPLDDSVTKVIFNLPQIMRRARGYVPLPLAMQHSNVNIFAAGAHQKSTFCLYKDGFAFVSQHFGDLNSIENTAVYHENYVHMCSLLKIQPQLAVCDMHPKYFTTEYANQLKMPVLKVQHHHAHIASVMAEQSITEPIIGVSFDGTGYGDDGKIWGGEFLVCSGAKYERVGYLKYVMIIGGDVSMKDAQKSAVCYLLAANIDDNSFDNRYQIIRSAIKQNLNTIETSSMGRLFDAVCALLGLCDYNSYEGECGIILENEAIMAVEKGYQPYPLNFEVIEGDILRANTGNIIQQIYQAKQACINIFALALGFHKAVADMVCKISCIIRSRIEINLVALSGGVFQNTLLTEMCVDKLTQSGFKVYINRNYPTNDGGISLGQAYIGLQSVMFTKVN